MEGNSVGVELLEHFDFSPETATVSAFNQHEVRYFLRHLNIYFMNLVVRLINQNNMMDIRLSHVMVLI